MIDVACVFCSDVSPHKNFPKIKSYFEKENINLFFCVDYLDSKLAYKGGEMVGDEQVPAVSHGTHQDLTYDGTECDAYTFVSDFSALIVIAIERDNDINSTILKEWKNIKNWGDDGEASGEGIIVYCSTDLNENERLLRVLPALKQLPNWKENKLIINLPPEMKQEDIQELKKIVSMPGYFENIVFQESIGFKETEASSKRAPRSF